MANTVFTTRLTEADWDDTLRGWRCPALAVPGAIVEALYVDGNRVDAAKFEVLSAHGVIRWTPAEQPNRVLASIKLTEDLTLGSETDRWKKLAIALPVAASIVTGTLSAAATYFSKSEPSTKTDSVQRAEVTPKPDNGPRPGIATRDDSKPMVPGSPTPVRQTSDNTSVDRAREIRPGPSDKGIASYGGPLRWYKVTIDGAMLDPPAHFLVRNLDASGSLLLSLFDSDEIRILAAEQTNANISIRPTNLAQGVYYVSVKNNFPFPEKVNYEFVFSR